MSRKHWWIVTKQKAETAGIRILLLGLVFLIIAACLVVCVKTYDSTWLLQVSLGTISLGLGFAAIGMSTKSDKKYTTILKRLNKNMEIIVMEHIEKQYQEFAKWAKKAQEYYHAKDKLMPKAQMVIPGKEIEPWIVTKEKLEEIERLDGLYEEAENKQREIMERIRQLKKNQL